MTTWKIGDREEIENLVSQEMINLFAQISGDNQPLHTNPAYAATTKFGGVIAHGCLTAAFISAVLGTRLPGPGTVFLKFELEFKLPVRPGDKITAVAEIIELGEKGRMTLRTFAHNQDGNVVAEGRSYVIAPR